MADRLLYLVTPGAGAWLSRKHIDFFTFVWIQILFGIIGLISYNIPERSRYRKRELFICLLWKDPKLRSPVTLQKVQHMLSSQILGSEAFPPKRLQMSRDISLTGTNNSWNSGKSRGQPYLHRKQEGPRAQIIILPTGEF